MKVDGKSNFTNQRHNIHPVDQSARLRKEEKLMQKLQKRKEEEKKEEKKERKKQRKKETRRIKQNCTHELCKKKIIIIINNHAVMPNKLWITKQETTKSEIKLSKTTDATYIYIERESTQLNGEHTNLFSVTSSFVNISLSFSLLLPHSPFRVLALKTIHSFPLKSEGMPF